MPFLLSRAIEGFLLNVGMRASQNTVRDYRTTLRHWQRFMGDDLPLEELTADDVRRFLYYLKVERELAPKTVKNAHTGISAFYSWAERELGVANVVRGRIQSPKATSRAIVPLTRHELRSLLDACDSKAPWKSSKRGPAVVSRPTRLRDRAIVLTLLDTGLRAQELCDLVVGDLDLKSGAVQVRHGKGDKARVVYLGATARETVWKYLSKRKVTAPDDPLFETVRRRPLDTDALRNMLLVAGQRAGIAEPVHPHRLRHTFAITYLRNGGDVFTLQRLLGHSTMDMVKRYLQLAQIDMAEAHRKASPVDNWRLG
jgi:integrase/recombinase XerD